MMIAMTHPMHGTHIAYTSLEINACKEAGWVEDPEYSKILAGDPQKRKPGRPPKPAEDD